MPKGSKKRKAAKKKIEEKEANSSTSHQQGNGDSRSQDEKESDRSEVNSPTSSQEHENPLSKEDEEKRGLDFLSIASITTQINQPHIQIGDKQEEGFEVAKDMNPNKVALEEGKFESRIINIESVKESQSNFGNSSSSSSSEEESEVGQKRKEIQTTPQIEESNEVTDFLETTVPIVEPIEKVVLLTEEDSVKQVVCQSEVVVQAVEVIPTENLGDSSVLDSPLEDKEEKILPLSSAQGVETSNGSEHPKESQIPASSENQQKDVASVPPTVRPTSWKSCCGLFDVLMSSNR